MTNAGLVSTALDSPQDARRVTAIPWVLPVRSVMSLVVASVSLGSQDSHVTSACQGSLDCLQVDAQVRTTHQQKINEHIFWNVDAVL